MLLPTGAPPYDAAAGSWIEILIIPPRVPSRPVEKPEASSSCSRQRKSRGMVGRSRRLDRSNEIHPQLQLLYSPLLSLLLLSTSVSCSTYPSIYRLFLFIRASCISYLCIRYYCRYLSTDIHLPPPPISLIHSIHHLPLYAASPPIPS
jgi:hypothetical protein